MNILLVVTVVVCDLMMTTGCTKQSMDTNVNTMAVGLLCQNEMKIYMISVILSCYSIVINS